MIDKTQPDLQASAREARMHHQITIPSIYFDQILSGVRTLYLSQNISDFAVGDSVTFLEDKIIDGVVREMNADVTYVPPGPSSSGYFSFSLRMTEGL